MKKSKNINWKLINNLQKKRLNKYSWARTQYDRMVWLKKTQIIPSFQNIFDPEKNITQAVFEKYDQRIHGIIDDHAITSVKGETGSGKSMFSLALATILFGKDFNIDYVKFTNNDILELCKDIGQKRIAIQDEQPETIGMGSYRESVEIKNLEEITRKHQLSLIFNAPTERIHNTAHFNFEIIEKSLKERVLHVAVFERKIDQYIGFIIIPILPDKDKLITEYIKKKDQFIKQILQRNSTRLDVKQMCDKIAKHPMIANVKNKSHLIVIVKELFPTLTIQEHKYISDYYDLHNPLNQTMNCEKCNKKTLRKFKDTFKCYICGWVK